jgi:hypothetical protein
MSASGTKRTCQSLSAMSAFGGKVGHRLDSAKCLLMTQSVHLLLPDINRKAALTRWRLYHKRQTLPNQTDFLRV